MYVYNFEGNLNSWAQLAMLFLCPLGAVGWVLQFVIVLYTAGDHVHAAERRPNTSCLSTALPPAEGPPLPLPAKEASWSSIRGVTEGALA